MKRARKIKLILLIIIMLLLAIISIIFAKNYKYSCLYRITYPVKNIGFDGKYINKKVLKFNEMFLWIGPCFPLNINNLDKLKLKKEDVINDIYIYFNTQRINLNRLTIDELKKLEAEIKYDEKSKVTTLNMASPEGFNPRYLLTGIIYNKKIIQLSFHIRLQPDMSMGHAQSCPISFSINNKFFKLPISQEEMEAIFGCSFIMERFYIMDM